MAFCSSLAFLLVRIFRLVGAVSISHDLYAIHSTPSMASSSPSKPRLSLPFSWWTVEPKNSPARS
ncbi:hypothetical protein C1H46_012883 [Malus baccata]|uniref:Secreted protein n=1 Tax=Malus baccata TaxID=106549 RepID=A0A540MT27_MALBA|nr:hypothetical protein C1H46_012883 [Malus baccata]